MVHVRFEGSAFAMSERALGVAPGMSDVEIFGRVAGFLDVPAERFGGYEVVLRSSGDRVVRPMAATGPRKGGVGRITR